VKLFSSGYLYVFDYVALQYPSQSGNARLNTTYGLGTGFYLNQDFALAASGMQSMDYAKA